MLDEKKKIITPGRYVARFKFNNFLSPEEYYISASYEIRDSVIPEYIDYGVNTSNKVIRNPNVTQVEVWRKVCEKVGSIYGIDSNQCKYNKALYKVLTKRKDM